MEAWGEIDGFNKNWAHERLTMLHTFSCAASVFTLVDQYRAKRRLCTSAIPDPSLDAGHAKRGRSSVEKHLRCHVGVSGETERRQFLQDRQRQQGMYSKRPRAFDLQYRGCTSETEVLLRRESVGPSGEHAELLGPCFFCGNKVALRMLTV